MRAVSLLLAVSLVGCFPHNKRARTISKWAEAGSLVAGIGMEYMANTGADCDAMNLPGQPTSSSCHTKAAVIGDVGVALILGGLLGFVATVSTSPDEDEPAPMPIKTETDKSAEKRDLKLPPGVKVPGASGSGSASASAGHPVP